jgi:5-formyltetrahydrofolate cyclo-ligase
MAFDCEGRRLGHGRGYYDRFFAGLDVQGLAYATIGFCLKAQLVERVPTDLYDKQMDVVCVGEDIISRKTGAFSDSKREFEAQSLPHIFVRKKSTYFC